MSQHEYPKNDEEFEETKIAAVRPMDGGGWDVTQENGWGLFVGPECPIKPEKGMVLRLYGRGIGYPFRGQFVDGWRVFYRTKEEDSEYQDIQLYGADAADWLSRWDAGKGVWSIEMGGLGPGYEQAIQITAAEILRHLLDAKYAHEAWDDKAVWERDRNAIREFGFANARIKALGLSGAQWGAAASLATCLYAQGPRAIFNDPKLRDRQIQVRRNFPQAAE